MSVESPVVCLIVDESFIKYKALPADSTLESLKEGQEAHVVFFEGAIPCHVRCSDNRWLVVWHPSVAMRKKEGMIGFPMNTPIYLSKYQPFFKFVNTNGSRLVRCLLVDQGMNVKKKKKKKRLKTSFFSRLS